MEKEVHTAEKQPSTENGRFEKLSEGMYRFTLKTQNGTKVFDITAMRVEEWSDVLVIINKWYQRDEGALKHLTLFECGIEPLRLKLGEKPLDEMLENLMRDRCTKPSFADGLFKR